MKKEDAIREFCFEGWFLDDEGWLMCAYPAMVIVRHDNPDFEDCGEYDCATVEGYCDRVLLTVGEVCDLQFAGNEPWDDIDGLEDFVADILDSE